MDQYYIFNKSELCVVREGDQVKIPAGPELELYLDPYEKHELGIAGASKSWSVPYKESMDLPQCDWVNLRSLFDEVSEETIMAAHLASQVATWARENQFCGQCGTATEHVAFERAKKCKSCNISFYPRVSPAVIVLVTRGDEFLLAKNKRFKRDYYSTLAGFVEAGESLESTIHREIKEEVGVEVGNLKYFGSQPWPFPHSLMVGFIAEYKSGDIVVDEEEIADAKWFTKNTMPTVPPKYSIARQMIDWYSSRI